MRHLLVAGAVCLVATSASASPEILPYNGIAGVWNYNLATGEKTPAGAERDLGPHIWGPTTPSGWFFALGYNDVVLDWADLGYKGYATTGFGFAYATNANHGSIDMILCFYGDDNGWSTPGRDYIAAFSLTGLNGTVTPQDRSQFWSWIYQVETFMPWMMTCNDLDQDILGDFSYTYWFDHDRLESPDPNPIVGPLIAGDPTIDDIPGAEDAFDLFNEPNYVPEPGYFDPNLTHYIGTYWLGGWPGHPFAQFYMELFGRGCYPGDSNSFCTYDIDGDCDVDEYDVQLCTEANAPDECDVDGDGWISLADIALILGQFGDDCRCRRAGQSGKYCRADIYAGDCAVNLSDLAKLLGNYGESGLTYWDGDIADWPYVGNGIVDINDLAELLSQYGDECN
jgi:hypothetical protein